MSTRFVSNRRRFLQTAAASTLALAPGLEVAARSAQHHPAADFSGLKPLGARLKPITPAEFRGRMEHAQKLMNDLKPGFEALFFAPGSSLYYFTGIHWGLSERLAGIVLPRTGKPVAFCPGFEEGRFREQLRFPIEVRVWQEDESPTQLAAKALADQGIRTGRLGVEETAYFTYYDHLRAAAPGFEYVSADPVTIACRGTKSAHELELMRLACEATFDVYKPVFAALREGMSQNDIAHLVETGFAKMGLRGGALVLLGPSAALPHGTTHPQTLKEGDVVLIDGGCGVDGYASDVTRMTVMGKPSDKVAKAYELVRQAQDAALDAARAGRLSGTVDDAARAVIVNGGYGPGYKFFTHRLGHGIGLDGHEHPYLVKGSTTNLQPGMTFSNEPGIYVVGEFGMRCEDDMVVMPDGPAQLLTPHFAVSLEKPMG
ncbi:MAG TPA: Xaa-Pro peptidase family protein [Candidatus Solibacter sp.]|nr:Xaa-Pro peptidase family protein [Candidatus Solibacter sp.]